MCRQEDTLDGKEILKELSPLGLSACIVYDSIDSTSSDAKRRALDGAAAPLLVLSDSQTAGRGRMGRSFYSPNGTGLYMSLLLPSQGYGASVGITGAAAVAVMRAIRCVCGIQTEIKWVNDLYLDGKKVCGILAEGFSADERAYTVIGIGINLYTEKFPDELEQKAGALMPETGTRNALAIAVCRELLSLITALPDRSFMDEYRKYSAVLSKKVVFIRNGESFCGVAESISDDGALTVRLENQEITELFSGEISLRVEQNT